MNPKCPYHKTEMKKKEGCKHGEKYICKCGIEIILLNQKEKRKKHIKND